MKKVMPYIFWSCILVILSISALYLCGYRINYTASLPVGIWRLSPYRATAPERGMYVAVSAGWDKIGIERGYHRADTKLLKMVTGLPGDVVACANDQIYINGSPLPNVIVQEHDSRNRPMPSFVQFPYVIQEHSYFLSAPVLKGWDSRYFGPVPRQEIQSCAHPVWIWH